MYYNDYVEGAVTTSTQSVWNNRKPNIKTKKNPTNDIRKTIQILKNPNWSFSEQCRKHNVQKFSKNKT